MHTSEFVFTANQTELGAVAESMAEVVPGMLLVLCSTYALICQNLHSLNLEAQTCMLPLTSVTPVQDMVFLCAGDPMEPGVGAVSRVVSVETPTVLKCQEQSHRSAKGSAALQGLGCPE